MFRILRYFSITSLVIILLAAGLLMVFYRHVAIQGVVELSEKSNTALAQTALNSVQDQLIRYLSVAIADAANARSGYPLSADLDRAIQNIMRDTNVVRVKIYNQSGVVVFSTNPTEIAKEQSDHPGINAAIQGKVASKFVYRDIFSSLDGVTENDNLIETYLPVRRTPTSPVLGVFEIYTDVNDLVRDAEHAEFVIMGGIFAILLLLYAALLAIVRSAERIIERQQDIIHERTRALEVVSARLMAGQENERKRIAGGLHEGLAQTLSAVKLNVENALRQTHHGRSESELKPFESVLQTLQGTIQDVRALAMELRPPSLDDLGLLDTLSWYLRKFRDANPGISLEPKLRIDEESVPEHLKTIVYRVVQEIFEYFTRQRHAMFIRVELTGMHDRILLVVNDKGQPYLSDDNAWPDEATIAATRERVALSGGTFSVETTPWGATTVRMSWPLVRSRIRSLA
jgi:signal transduction histidine kinase